MAVQINNRSSQKKAIIRLNGGLNTRESQLVIEANSDKRQQAITLNNVDLFKDGAVQKRLGKTQQGNNVSGGAALWASQTSTSGTRSVLYSSGGSQKIAQKIVAGSSVTITQIEFSLAVVTSATPGYTVNTYAEIWSDSSGTPGAVIANGTSGAQSVTVQALGSSASVVVYTFAVPPSVTSGSTYWFVVSAASSSINQRLDASVNSGVSSNVRTSTTGGSTWAGPFSEDLYYVIYKGTSAAAITGIYDYRYGAAQTRQQLVTNNGVLYKRDKSGSSFISTWTSLANTLDAGQDYLTSFATLQDLAFATQGNATAPAVVWDGASTGAMRHGYRLSPPYVANYKSLTVSSTKANTVTMAAAQGASGLYVGKKVWLFGSSSVSPEEVTIRSFVTAAASGSAAGSYTVSAITFEEDIESDHTSVRFNGATVATGTGGSSAITSSAAVSTLSILGITALKSGGYRAQEFSIDIPNAGGPYKVAFSNCAMNGTTNGTEFGFEIAAGASNGADTTWYVSSLFNPGYTLAAGGTTPTAPTVTYYRLPSSTTNISTGLNPTANSQTAFDVNTAATTTWTTPLDDYGFPLEYFTGQIDAPRSKYLTVFQGFLVSAGDPSKPNRFWISPADAPQVWGTAGGSYGSYFDLDTNDGDVITGVAAWNTALYIFKRHSVYYAEYTAVASQPLTIRRLQASLGALSHWSTKAVDWGIAFLSERGPAYVSGASLGLIPGADNIQNLFDPTDSVVLNLSVMRYSTAGHNSTKQQLWWGVASTNATNRDQILVYDYANRAFWINTDSANYLTEVGDANSFFSVWSGDYNGNVFQQELGSTDNGGNIPFTFESCWLTLGGIAGQEQLDRIWIAGDTQTSSSTLTVDIYRDYSTTASRTVTYDMTSADFPSGLHKYLNLRGNVFKFKLTNTSAVPLKINAVTLEYQPLGGRV